MKKRESGFSVLELVIVLAIALVVAAMAAPSLNRVIDNYRLNASGRDVASLLQQARMVAVESNQPYYVQFNVCGAPNIACAVPAGRFLPFAVIPGDPHAVNATNVAFQGAGLPNTATLDAAVGGAPPPAQINGVIGFNARGMPCVQTVSPWVCTPGAGFEWLLQNTKTLAWAAVTVTPAGRIRTWRMTAPGVWQ
jgi:prepilin-type N-terminal cleavage/methylation domain-containing protein